jgi:Tfp pilus assembly protein PilF
MEAHQKNKSLLFGLAERERGPSGKWQIKFRLGRIFALFAALTLLMCSLVYLALYLHFKYSGGYDAITVRDVITFPFDREGFRHRRGEFHLERGIELLEASEYNEAYTDLLRGVFLSPDNTEGRLMLAEFQSAIRKPELAMRTLEGGLKYSINDPVFMKRYLETMLLQQKDQQVMDIADQVLQANPSPELRDLMASAAAQAHFFRGNYDQAEQYIENYNLDQDAAGYLLLAEISWLRNQQQRSLELLEIGLKRFPAKDPFYARLTLYHREMGNLSAAQRYATLRNVNTPLSVAPRVDLMAIWNRQGHTERARNEALKIAHQFRENEQALVTLGEYATNAMDVTLVNRIYATALENDYDVAKFAMLVMETYITSGDYEGAVAFGEDLANQNPVWLREGRYLSIFNSLRAVAYMGIGNEDLSQLYIEQFLADASVRPSIHLVMAKRLSSMDAPLKARQVLSHAVVKNPDNQNALTQLIALELELGNSSEVGPYLKRLLQMRRPSHQVLLDAYQRLGSDRFIFTPDRNNILSELRALLFAGETA